MKRIEATHFIDVFISVLTGNVVMYRPIKLSDWDRITHANTIAIFKIRFK